MNLQPIQEVDMKRRRERIPLPESRLDLATTLGKLGVVKRDANRLISGVTDTILFQHRCEQTIGFPLATGKHFVISAPVLMLASDCANGPRQGTPPQRTKGSQGKAPWPGYGFVPEQKPRNRPPAKETSSDHSAFPSPRFQCKGVLAGSNETISLHYFF